MAAARVCDRGSPHDGLLGAKPWTARRGTFAAERPRVAWRLAHFTPIPHALAAWREERDRAVQAEPSPGDDDEADNTELNRDYTADNILEGPVNSFLAGHVGAEYIDPNELLEAVRDTGMTTQKNQMLIKDAMTRMGWSLRRGSAAEFGPHRPRKWFRT